MGKTLSETQSSKLHMDSGNCGDPDPYCGQTISQVGGSIQSNVIEEFFVTGMGLGYNEGLSRLGFLKYFFLLISLLANLQNIRGSYWKEAAVSYECAWLCDWNGTLLFSSSFIMYIAGMCCISFFVSHDMQVTYILESRQMTNGQHFMG